jgi:hypothetical protein
VKEGRVTQGHEQVVSEVFWEKKMKPPKLSGRIADTTTREASDGSYHSHGRSTGRRTNEEWSESGRLSEMAERLLATAAALKRG